MTAEQTHTPAPRPPGCGARQIWLMVLIIFAAGIGIGVGAGRMMWHKPRRTRPRTMEETSRKMLGRINDAVDLTDEQAEQVGRVVQQRVRAFWKVREVDVLPRYEEQFELLSLEVGALLTDRQQPAWEEFCKQYRQRYFTLATTRPAE